MKAPRKRGEAFTGRGYGTQRFVLFQNAREHIERSISAGYYCEAIAIIESVVADGLESRLSFLRKENIGFKNLGDLIKLAKQSGDHECLEQFINPIEAWRIKRNTAIHELTKVEAGLKNKEWAERISDLRTTAVEGYKLLCALYNRVADLNPNHPDRVFPTRQESLD